MAQPLSIQPPPKNGKIDIVNEEIQKLNILKGH